MPKNDNEPGSDLQAAVAEAKPATAEKVKFSYDGVEYEVAADIQSSIEFNEHLEDGNLTLLARAVVGRSQWAMFRRNHTSYQEALDLVNAWSTAAGLGK